MQAVANEHKRTSTKDMNVCGDCVRHKTISGENYCTKSGRRELDHMSMVQYSPCGHFEPKMAGPQSEDDLEQLRRLGR